MRLLLLLLFLAPFVLLAEEISTPVTLYAGTEASPIDLRGAVELDRVAQDGTPISGLSALAWDEDERILYAVSDRGRVHHLRPEFEEGRLKRVELLDSFKLQDRKGKPLTGRWRDSEGAFVKNGDNATAGDSELVISFERSPRIVRYAPDGKQLGRYKLPAALRNADNYEKPNNGLEAVTRHAEKGVLTIPQKPLKSDPDYRVYALDGESWPYRVEQEKSNVVVAAEALPDGRLLIMERAWHSIWYPLVITLKEVRFGDDGAAESRTLAKLSSQQGWMLDNFEGLSRHRDDNFFIVSDDNGNSYQRTLLLYFGLPKPQTE